MWSYIDQDFIFLDEVALPVRQSMRECVRVWTEVQTPAIILGTSSQLDPPRRLRGYSIVGTPIPIRYTLFQHHF